MKHIFVSIQTFILIEATLYKIPKSLKNVLIGICQSFNWVIVVFENKF